MSLLPKTGRIQAFSLRHTIVQGHLLKAGLSQRTPSEAFTQWFSYNGFGTNVYPNYENTPVGAITHTYEPYVMGIEDAQTHFGLWASWKTLAICAWNSRNTPYFQVVGDPFVKR